MVLKNKIRVFVGSFLIISGIIGFLNKSRELMKEPPYFYGVDEQAKLLNNEYLRLSTENHLIFHHKVPISLIPFASKQVIGTCYIFNYHREIEIDINYWKNNSSTQKEILLFHELTHCYCGRDHDWDLGQNYPDSYFDIKWQSLKHFFGFKKSGYWNDGCPMTIMHPSIISDKCYKKHYSRYVKEMFERCETY